MKTSMKQAGRAGASGAARRGALAVAWACGAWGAAAMAQQPNDPVPPAAFEQCGAELPPDQAAMMLQNWLEGAYADAGVHAEDTFVIRLRLSTVRDNAGNNGLTNQDLDDAVTALNGFYNPIGVSFVETHSRRFINSSQYNVLSQGEFNPLLDAFNTSNVLDIYFVQTFTDGQGQPLNGQSTFTTDASAGVVVVNGATPSRGSNFSTIPHEVGHYFDLLHTHETSFGVECPNELNCAFAGDQVCDTPADPDLSVNGNRVDGGCNAVNMPGIPTACQFPNNPYRPDARNIMSYSTVTCRNHISGGQETRFKATIRAFRSDHQWGGESLADTWVDFGATPGGSGASTSPKDTLPAALAATQGGGRVVITASSHTSPFTGTINQAVTLDSWHGASTIGR